MELKGKVRQVRTWANFGSVSFDIKDKDGVVNSVDLKVNGCMPINFSKGQKYKITLELADED